MVPSAIPTPCAQSVAQSDRPVVRSSISYDTDVAAVCHHSKLYLTHRETNPKPVSPLREIHDFPGLNNLDREFQKAAHAEKYHHLIWSPIGTAGSAMVISGIVLLGTILPLIARRNQTANVIEFVLIYGFLALAVLAGFMLIVWGTQRISRRFDIYHEHAREGTPVPTREDFPLLHCRYTLEANERLSVNLSTSHQHRSKVHKQDCRLKIEVRTQDIEQNRADFHQYRALYDDRYGTHLYAGMVALEGIHTLTDETRQQLDLDHRILLRAVVPESFKSGTPNSREDRNPSPLIAIEKSYTITGSLIEPDYAAGQYFPLVFFAHLYDSYTVELIFQWHGNPEKATDCMLDMCELQVPKELEASIREVRRGRYDVEQRRLIWQGLRFHTPIALGGDFLYPELRLLVVFDQPLLEYQPMLQGSYRCLLNNLLSDLQVQPHLIWDARGLNILQQESEAVPSVYRHSSIAGELALDVKQLIQDHEYVVSKQICNPRKPDHALIHDVLNALIKWEVDVQNIEAAEPRYELSNDQPLRTYYWDIIGQWHDLVTLNTFDVYVVITSQDKPEYESHGGKSEPENTSIEVRVRCIHEPRNPTMRYQADKLLESVAEELQPSSESEVLEAAQSEGSKQAEIVDKITVGDLELCLKNAGAHWWLQARSTNQVEVRAITIRAIPSQTINSSPRLFEVMRLSPNECSDDMAITLRRVHEDSIEQQLVELLRDIKDTQKRITELRRLSNVAGGPIERARYEYQREDQQNRLAALQHMKDDLEQPAKVQLQMLVSYKAGNANQVDHDIQTLTFMMNSA